MSLKIFHILFIFLATLMSLGCAAWSYFNQTAPLFGIGSALAAVALIIYGVIFIKKSKKIIT
ncbi:MAG: hypothetical protein JWL59_1056 [Chthoniobacteraceae bacterium]|nr:hypothetical protein [Chthoniobacteraceae bacterium]